MADKVLDSADLLLAPSEFVAEKFKTMGLKKEIKIIPLGIRSLDRLKPTGQNNITFGFVGTINKLKNVEMLIEAFSLTDDDISLKIYGSGEYEFIEKIKALTKKDRRISYYGEYKTAHLPKIFSELDIAVVPSFIESYSLVVREAFSAGVPVIASNVGGIPEIVENGVNGLLFNPYNKVELLSLIKKVSKDTGLLHNLRKGIKPVKSINQEASELISEYKLLTNDNNIEVSILIPVFNKLEFTRICIDSVYENTPNTESYEIIVVDNASSDGTNVYLNEQRDIRNNFKIITNPTNFGFAKANNQAAAKALGKYLVTLNNDTLVKPGWLESLKKTVESDPTVAAAGSKLIYPDMTIQHAGVVIVNNRGDENPLVAIHIHSKKPSDFPEANKTRTFKALTAACLLIKKNAFEEAGGFDEEYYNGYEDVDLCFKLGEIGYKLVYQPESEVIHYESQSGRERFVKITHNVERLNKKWHNKIVADYWTDENKTLIPLKENKIACDNNETKEPEVSIIILSFSQLEYTKQFIESVFHFTKTPFELILIDNGSDKETVDYIKLLGESDEKIKGSS